MNPSEFAARLTGREYLQEITKVEKAEAKAAGLVVMFGCSDDNVDVCGAVDGDGYGYNGVTMRMTPLGLLPHWPDDLVSECWAEDYFRRKAAGFRTIEAEWSPKDEPSLSWRFKTEIPHATFDVMEDGEVFCRGIVFRLVDVLAQPKGDAVQHTENPDHDFEAA